MTPTDSNELSPKQEEAIANAVLNLKQGKKNIKDLTAIISNATPSVLMKSFYKFSYVLESSKMGHKSIFQVVYENHTPQEAENFTKNAVRLTCAMRKQKFDSRLFEKRIIDFAKTITPKGENFPIKTRSIERYVEFLSGSAPPYPVTSDSKFLIRPNKQRIANCSVIAMLNALTYSPLAMNYLKKNVITRKNGGFEIKLLLNWDALESKRISYFFTDRELDQIDLSRNDRGMRALEAALMCLSFEQERKGLDGRGGGEMLFRIIEAKSLKGHRKNLFKPNIHFQKIRLSLETYHDKAEGGAGFIRTFSTHDRRDAAVKTVDGKSLLIIGNHAYSIKSVNMDKKVVVITNPNHPAVEIKLSVDTCCECFSGIHIHQVLA